MRKFSRCHCKSHISAENVTDSSIAYVCQYNFQEYSLNAEAGLKEIWLINIFMSYELQHHYSAFITVTSLNIFPSLQVI